VTGMPYCIMVNVAKAPTDDLKVRQALQYAISQEQIVEALYSGVYGPSHNIFLPGTTGYDESLNAMYTYDPAKAGALLDEAGWAMDGDVRKKNGEELKLNFVNIANFGFDDISLLMQAQFQEVGITAEISAQSFPAVGETYNRGDHNLADFFYYSVDPFFMRALFACDQIESGFNWMHYCKPELDQMVRDGNATGDVATRQQIYAAAAKVVMEDAAVIPIYEQRAVFVGKNTIANLGFSINGYPYFQDVSVQ
jgi:peptide/nickel transport system substrate-binding protein